MSQFTAIDAFCGAGGLSLGLKRAGFKILGGFDLEPLCIQTLKSNSQYISHPASVSDIRDIVDDDPEAFFGVQRGDLDLLAGGPPCQGFSIQRTIGEDKDDRNLLVDDYANLILKLLPRFFLLENVPGIGGKRGRFLLEAFKSKMKQSGYTIHEKILNARDYDVPQRRNRFIVVGERSSELDASFNWPLPSASGQTVRDIIGNLPAPPIGVDHPLIRHHRADRLSETNLARIRAIKSGQSRVDLPEKLLANCHRRGADEIGHRNVYGRMDWDDVSPTITARFDSFTRGKFGHPEQDRSISLYEGALLQTFPSDYVFCGNKTEVARQIGNAVPPNLAFAIGCSIVQALTTSDKGCIEMGR